MLRTLAIAVGAVAVLGFGAAASADPAEQDGSIYAIGKCYDPGRPPVQRPVSFA